MTFWTHASKHVFPKRSTKMVDGTEKAKMHCQYEEFHYKTKIYTFNGVSND